MSQINDLNDAFPAYTAQIHRLRAEDGHFKRLVEEYEQLGKELHRIENEVETPEDAYVETCKKKRLALKDEMAGMLAKAAA